MAPPTILIVDSDVLIRSEIAAYLRDCGYEVTEVASGEEAQQVLSTAEPIKVALADARLPGSVDGFAFAQWVRAHKPEVGVILAATVERAAAAAGGLCEEGPMLSRPYDPQIVVDRIKRLLAGNG
jgi:DNA-binding response OmpR family regulator